MTCGRLQAWPTLGVWRLQSEAAATVARLCHQVAAVLPCPLPVYSPGSEERQEDPPSENLDVGWTAIRGTRIRAGIPPQGGALSKWMGRLARVPLTAEAVRELLKIWYGRDELAAIRMLGDCNSVSSGIYWKLGLTRAVIKDSLRELAAAQRSA